VKAKLAGQLTPLKQKNPAAEANGQLVAGLDRRHLTHLGRIHQVGRTQHRHRVSSFEIPGLDPELHACSQVELVHGNKSWFKGSEADGVTPQNGFQPRGMTCGP
jgi:hypothetical protein